MIVMMTTFLTALRHHQISKARRNLTETFDPSLDVTIIDTCIPFIFRCTSESTPPTLSLLNFTFNSPAPNPSIVVLTRTTDTARTASKNTVRDRRHTPHAWRVSLIPMYIKSVQRSCTWPRWGHALRRGAEDPTRSSAVPPAPENKKRRVAEATRLLMLGKR